MISFLFSLINNIFLALIIIITPSSLLNAQDFTNDSSFNLLVGATGKERGIYVFEFDGQSGDFTYKNKIRGKEVNNPSYLAISKDQEKVYAVNKGENGKGAISAFDFNRVSGALTFLNQVSSGGAGPAYVTIDEKSKFVFAGNFGGGSLSAIPVEVRGTLHADTQIIQHKGSSTIAGRQDKPHVHCTVLSPDGHFLLVTDLGTDKINIYRFDADKKSRPLSVSEPAFVTVEPGGGPRHVTFHPNGKFAYLIQEMGGSITAYKYHNGDLAPIQTITMVAKGYTGEIRAADIHVSPDGKFLYGSNRGDANEIVIYAIDENGKLAFRGRQSTLGKTPRNFVIDPTGNYLLTANQASNNIVNFKRNKETGSLTPTGKKIEIGGPACLKFAKGAGEFPAGIYSMDIHDMSVSIDANVGGRVTSLKLAGKELLGSKAIHPSYYGSTLWMGPQGKWDSGVRKLLDASRYNTILYNRTDLYLKSEVDSSAGFSFAKEFYANKADTSLVIRYSITNISDDVKDVAPWEVTRVPTGGLSFFPKGTEPALLKSNLSIRDSINIVWYPYDYSTVSKQKMFMNGSEGWLAHVQDGMVFIKQFPDIAPVQAAPGEEEVEIYVNKDKTYVELENQGSYQRLISGASLVYEVKWYVRTLPKDIQAQIGNRKLIDFVRSIIR